MVMLIKEPGEAYAFFDCNAPRGMIDAYLRGSLQETSGECKHDYPKPSELEVELSLREIKELGRDRNDDPDLLEFIRDQRIYTTFPSRYKELMKTAKPILMRDLKYVIEAKDDNMSNEDVANQLGIAMNSVYLRFGEKKPFNVVVVAKIDGEYMFKE